MKTEQRMVLMTEADLERMIAGAVKSALARPATEEIFTTEQVAERLGVHVKTVGRFVRTAGLPAHPIGKGRRYRFRASEVDAWIVSREVRKAG